MFQSSQAGFRFLVPEGWIQGARAELPAGRLAQERLLVRYESPNDAHPVVLEVTALTRDPHEDPAVQVTRASYGAGKWQLSAAPEALDLGGVAATRLDCTAVVDKVPMTKEVVIVPRGDREYHFIGLFASTDSVAREQVRRLIGSVVWK